MADIAASFLAVTFVVGVLLATVAWRIVLPVLGLLWLFGVL